MTTRASPMSNRLSRPGDYPTGPCLVQKVLQRTYVNIKVVSGTNLIAKIPDVDDVTPHDLNSPLRSFCTVSTYDENTSTNAFIIGQLHGVGLLRVVGC